MSSYTCHLIYEQNKKKLRISNHVACYRAYSRLGVVYVPENCVACSSRFAAWLDSCALCALLGGTDVSKDRQIKARLVELADLLLWPMVEYMASRGDTVFREDVATFQVGVKNLVVMSLGVKCLKGLAVQ